MSSDKSCSPQSEHERRNRALYLIRSLLIACCFSSFCMRLTQNWKFNPILLCALLKRDTNYIQFVLGAWGKLSSFLTFRRYASQSEIRNSSHVLVKSWKLATSQDPNWCNFISLSHPVWKSRRSNLPQQNNRSWKLYGLWWKIILAFCFAPIVVDVNFHVECEA